MNKVNISRRIQELVLKLDPDLYSEHFQLEVEKIIDEETRGMPKTISAYIKNPGGEPRMLGFDHNTHTVVFDPLKMLGDPVMTSSMPFGSSATKPEMNAGTQAVYKFGDKIVIVADIAESLKDVLQPEGFSIAYYPVPAMPKTVEIPLRRRDDAIPLGRQMSSDKLYEEALEVLRNFTNPTPVLTADEARVAVGLKALNPFYRYLARRKKSAVVLDNPCIELGYN